MKFACTKIAYDIRLFATIDQLQIKRCDNQNTFLTDLTKVSLR